MNMVRPIGAIVLAATVVACAGVSERDVPTRPAISVPPMETVGPRAGAGVTGEVPEEILSSILSDTSERTGVPAEEIAVLRDESVTWADGSLGCPERDTMYTQAQVDGYHVVVEAGGEELDYRVGEGGGFRICDQPNRPGG